MPRYDVADEAVLDASPHEVWCALQAEASGASSWWFPYVRTSLRAGPPLGEVGAVVDYAVESRGRLDSPMTMRFAGRVVEAEPDRRMLVHYFDGALRGSAEWTLEPLDGGRTRIRLRWLVEPFGLLARLLARVIDVPAAHSRVVQYGFQGLDGYLGRTHARR